MTDHPRKQGRVYLVGAGPGDPGLVTVKALECLKQADAVVYDFLVNPGLLAHAAQGAELIYVGKKGSDHTLDQSGINALLVDLANKGRTVVRLKGGDPFIFGRGGEEAEELVRAGIAFEIVPGVSSAVAAPAYAGIPLTHRRFTSSVGFLTGHEDPTKPDSALDWDRIATGLGTLVFLMGVRNLSTITARLIEAGRGPDTPAALVRWGTTPNQATLTGTLADLAEKARALDFQPPAVLVVGEVVTLRDTLNWFETLPLFGRRIMVTRSRTQASRLTGALTALGAEVIECPTISMAPPVDWSEVDRVLDRLADFGWLVLTSPNGVIFLMERLKTRGLDARSLAPVKLAAIGPATAEKLEEYGLRADQVPGEYVGEALSRTLIEQGASKGRVLLLRSDKARQVLPQSLTAAGADVEDVALYRTLTPSSLPPEAEQALDQNLLDLVTFTSSSTVINLAGLLGNRFDKIKDRIAAACIGPITARTRQGTRFVRGGRG